MKWYERIISAVGGILLVDPGILTDAAGLTMVGLVFAAQWLRYGKKRKVCSQI
jgi:UPF0716 family protein affecting phage T7 exclusion